MYPQLLLRNHIF